jgi:hypothetical protein
MASVGIGYTDGRLTMEQLYAVCLPTPEKPAESVYLYNPDGGGKLSTVVKRADGTVLNTYVWYGEKISNLWELSRYKVLGGYEAIKPLSAGDYVLEFAIEDKPFYRFPFSISEINSDDPYAPAGKRYFMDGPWNDYGNIFYQRNDPQSLLSFTTWVRDKSGHENKRSVPYELKLARGKDGKVLAEDVATMRLVPRWNKIEFLLRPIEGDKNSYFKAGDVLREDGPYNLRFALDGKPYGTYSFTVNDGRIQLQGRQVREKADPMTWIVDYVYGGKYTSWWIKRTK